VDLHDPRMVQRCHHLGLAQEAAALLFVGMSAGQDHLQRHLPGTIDHAHAAPTQFRDHLGGRRAAWARLEPGNR
jgi:hypothetical protein